MSGTIRSVADDFLKDKTDTVFTDTNVYQIFCGYVTPDYAVFRSVYARKAELVKRYGEKAGLHLDKACTPCPRCRTDGSLLLRHKKRRQQDQTAGKGNARQIRQLLRSGPDF